MGSRLRLFGDDQRAQAIVLVFWVPWTILLTWTVVSEARGAPAGDSVGWVACALVLTPFYAAAIGLAWLALRRPHTAELSDDGRIVFRSVLARRELTATDINGVEARAELRSPWQTEWLDYLGRPWWDAPYRLILRLAHGRVWVSTEGKAASELLLFIQHYHPAVEATATIVPFGWSRKGRRVELSLSPPPTPDRWPKIEPSGWALDDWPRASH